MKQGAIIGLMAATLACSHVHDEELPAIAVTNWTDKLELFMEYDALVVDRETRFAVHLTELANSAPLSRGAPVLELTSDHSPPLRFEAPTPSRPGIFRVVATVPKPGRYRMRLEVFDPVDRHELGDVTVYSTTEQAIAAQEEEPESEPTISFLKEQQWVTDFLVEQAQQRSLHQTVRIPAEVRPRAGGEASILAPVGGRLVLQGAPPAPGSRVRRGQSLARIAPRVSEPEDRASLELTVAETEAELAQAQRNRARAERLLAAKATPAKRLEEARRDETVAMARHETAQKRLRQLEETIRSGGGGSDEAFIDLITPLSGVLVKSNATPGAAVETGEKLFQIVDPDLVYVVGAVPEAEVHRVRETIGVELHIPGRDEPVVLNSRVSLGAAVDPASRTVPIVYQVENREGLLLVGQAVSLVLVTHEALSALSIPMTALVDEGGQSIVYVQVGGEDFARRQLDIGIRDRDYVQVLSGLGEGERIVTRGAYEVRLASLSGTIPAEGHVH